MFAEDPKARWFQVPYQSKKYKDDPATQRAVKLYGIVNRMKKKYYDESAK